MSRNILVDSSVRLLFSVPLPELELHAGMMLSGGRITSEGFTVTGRISISRLSFVSRLLSADPDPEPEAAPELPADLPEAKLQIVAPASLVGAAFFGSEICAYSCVLNARTRAISLASLRL